MYGSILLAQLGQSALLKGINEHNIHERFIRMPQDQLAFAAEDEEGHQAQFIPLFRVEEETYSVYLDLELEKDPSADKRFSIAEVGSAAYENETS
ncbi:hypothetical protein MKY42_18420 [Paenibacillus sp. FSL W7-1088]|uniref:hypothetical protein n=1 Tax=Paenibacillus sp. FSL W7-1088 TaxID=2921695 RepID=UPI0030EF55E7